MNFSQLLRTITALFFFFFMTQQSVAQDTIHFVNHDIKIVKVEEIGLSDVKYHRFENVSGPMYIASKREIDYIVYANGQLEKMNNPAQAATPVTASAPPSSGDNSSSQRIFVRRGKLIYNGSRLSDRELGDLIDRYPKPEIKLRLENEYELLTKYKRNSVIWKVVALGVGIGAPVVGTVVYIGSYGATTPGIGLLTSVIVGTTGCVLTKIYKNKHRAKATELADLYNGNN